MACSPELRRVPELACVPEVLQECNDFAKEVPFLEQVEECEEVVYDDCVEVREKIPVEVAIQLSILSSPQLLSTHLTLSHPTSTPLSPPPRCVTARWWTPPPSPCPGGRRSASQGRSAARRRGAGRPRTSRARPLPLTSPGLHP